MVRRDRRLCIKGGGVGLGGNHNIEGVQGGGGVHEVEGGHDRGDSDNDDDDGAQSSNPDKSCSGVGGAHDGKEGGHEDDGADPDKDVDEEQCGGIKSGVGVSFGGIWNRQQ